MYFSCSCSTNQLWINLENEFEGRILQYFWMWVKWRKVNTGDSLCWFLIVNHVQCCDANHPLNSLVFCHYYFTFGISNYQVIDVCRDFVLTRDDLELVTKKLTLELNQGLGKATNADATVKCFPTYVRNLPTGTGNSFILNWHSLIFF